MPENVRVVGIGGPSCSGKTTLTKHLRTILDPQAHILHQDDFAPPADKLPIRHGVQDWDDPEGAIEWSLMADAMRHCKTTGELPPDLQSHDHLNVLDPVPVQQETLDKWRRRFAQLDGKIKFILVDGFILYWDKPVFDSFDVKFFIRESYDVLKHRRSTRNGYFTSSQSVEAGQHWKDPPGFWDDIVWPAFIKSHKACFLNGDVERGTIDPDSDAGRGLQLLDGEKYSMDQLLDKACQDIWESLQERE